MDNGNEDPDYDATQKLIDQARIDRDLTVGGAIGQACAMAWRAITVASTTLQTIVASRRDA